MSRARVINMVDMIAGPNKPGPVELQTAAIAALAPGREIDLAVFFSGPVPDAYREQLEAAGARVGLFDHHRWRSDVIEVCARERPHLAHFHFGPYLGMTEVARQGVRVVITAHSPRAPQRFAPLRAAVRHWRTRRVDRFIAVSEFIARQTMRDFAIGRERIRVVLNGTDIERFRPRPEDKPRLRAQLLGLRPEHVVMTLAAHMRPAKRQEMAILAMPAILAAAPQARLVLAGDGPSRDALHELVRAQGLGDAVRFLHGDNDVAAIYAASDIAVLPSVSEGLPGSGIEAIACGLPLVATPNGGTPEVYEDGVSGVSVHDQTSGGLAAAVIPLAVDQARRERIGRAARKRAEEVFGIDRVARETLSVYEELLSRQHPTAS